MLSKYKYWVTTVGNFPFWAKKKGKITKNRKGCDA
jgi:hypothetical protein